MTELLDCIPTYWQPGIGDPSLAGWLTVLLYVLVGLLAFRVAGRVAFPVATRGRERSFWIIVGCLMLCLAVNKQLDLQSALTARVTASSASLGSAASSFASHASFAASLVADNRVDAEKELSFAQAHATALKTQELAGGVDTDAELQHLMQIEQAYAANAQVIRVVDELLQLLLR